MDLLPDHSPLFPSLTTIIFRQFFANSSISLNTPSAFFLSSKILTLKSSRTAAKVPFQSHGFVIFQHLLVLSLFHATASVTFCSQTPGSVAGSRKGWEEVGRVKSCQKVQKGYLQIRFIYQHDDSQYNNATLPVARIESKTIKE